MRDVHVHYGQKFDAINTLQISILVATLVLALIQGIFSFHRNKHSKFQFNQHWGPKWKPAMANVAYSLDILII